MLRFDSIIKHVNTLELALENNRDIIRPSLDLITSFNEIKPDLLKIKYNFNKKKIIKHLEELDEKEALTIIVSESVYYCSNIDKIFELIIKIHKVFKPSIISIGSYSEGALIIKSNKFNASKINELESTLLEFDAYILEEAVILPNIGSLEKFLILETEFGETAIQKINVKNFDSSSNKINLYISQNVVDIEYKIIKEECAFRESVDTVFKVPFFKGVIIDGQGKPIPVLSLAYVLKNLL